MKEFQKKASRLGKPFYLEDRGSSAREAGQTLDGVDAHRAGVQADDGDGRVADEEGVALELVQVLQHFQEGAVLRHQDIVEGLDVRHVALDGDAVAETDALDLVVRQPLGAVGADLQAVVGGAAGQAGERRDLVRAVQDDGVAGLDAVADGGFQVTMNWPSGSSATLGQSLSWW